MEFWFSFHRKHRSRQMKSPRATFPSTINALLYSSVEDDERIRFVLDFTSQRNVRQLLGSLDFDRISSRARTLGPHRRPSHPHPLSLSLFSVKLGSYPAWSLRGSESRQPTSSSVGSLRARHRHRRRPIRKRNVDVACASLAREPTDENSTFLSLSLSDDLGWFLVACVRVCVRVAETTT